MNTIATIIRVSFFILLLGVMTSCRGQDKPQQTKAGERVEISKDRVAAAKVSPENSNGPIRKQGIASGNFSPELEDKAGNIWFSSGGEGVYKYNGSSFQNFTTKDGLLDNGVSGIAEDKEGNILFGTAKGLCRYNGQSIKPLTESIDESRQAISSLLVDKDGNIWFGTWNNGVYRYDGKDYTNFLNNGVFNLGNKNQLIQDILEDKAGKLWFSSWNGGGVWMYDGAFFQNFLPNANYYQSGEDNRKPKTPMQHPFANSPKEAVYEHIRSNITDDMINSIAEDKSGNIWFATRRHGACRYDGKNFTSYRETEGFVSYGITSILESKNGLIWLATDKNGVYAYDGKTFKNFTMKDGLVYNSVRSMLEDKNGNIWMATRGFGLSRYDGKTFTTFSTVKQ